MIEIEIQSNKTYLKDEVKGGSRTGAQGAFSTGLKIFLGVCVCVYENFDCITLNFFYHSQHTMSTICFSYSYLTT